LSNLPNFKPLEFDKSLEGPPDYLNPFFIPVYNCNKKYSNARENVASPCYLTSQPTRA